MKRIATLLACAAAAGLSFAPAKAEGTLGLLPQGQYVCALPGTAAGAAWVEDTERQFKITGASSYRSGAGSGTYLLEGKTLLFTRGPMKGLKMLVLNSGLIQEIDAQGKMGRLRCHRLRSPRN